jgi:hypothetical protein
LCSNGGHDEKGEAACRGHLAIGIIIIFITGYSFDKKMNNSCVHMEVMMRRERLPGEVIVGYL